MAGINRALSDFRIYSESRKNRGIKCVFLSHQQRDKKICKIIADYLLKAEIDVYFDEYDEDLKIYRQSNRPKGVVDSIKKGIDKSSNMLAIISPNTIYSKWVPWEIGYGYDQTVVTVLTLKGIKDFDLPEYLKTVEILRGTKSLNSYLSRITGKLQLLMESSDLIKSHTMAAHPLDDILDWNH